MAKKKTSNKVPANVKKKYANFAHCDHCNSEQQMRRVMVIGTGKRKRWACLQCSTVLSLGKEAPSREYT